ncbi:SDR family NAD(P)-dependent oxidoreductase [Nocardioides limicola]|uniref:SDR family NAD(P)-dependent oxidoreductase n=1 Tax=Nocardioides limicola TaxID=2803368 RepID=UPI00193AFC6F|nr:SDR family NAD(P)-dependent oxidoreductase [Nocardioides sp. DJM-14]
MSESEQLPVAVVTGAANGIGLELTRRLASTHRVALLDRNEQALLQATETIQGSVGIVCDITDQASVQAAVAAAVDRFGRIDVAISNAGIGAVGVARHLDPDALARQLDVNLTGNWRFIHACIPHLIESKGYLLGVASAAAIMAPPGEGFYAASKAGLEALLDVVRVELAHVGVDVGVAYLMFIDTPMVRTGEAQHPDLLHMRTGLPGPVGKTYSVAEAADTLARGVRRRSARVFVPGSLRLQYLLHAVARPLLDILFRRVAPEVDRLTAVKVAERGPFDAAFNTQDPSGAGG